MFITVTSRMTISCARPITTRMSQRRLASPAAGLTSDMGLTDLEVSSPFRSRVTPRPPRPDPRSGKGKAHRQPRMHFAVARACATGKATPFLQSLAVPVRHHRNSRPAVGDTPPDLLDAHRKQAMLGNSRVA